MDYFSPFPIRRSASCFCPVSATRFGQLFCPSSGALDCVYSLWYNSPTMLPAGGRQHRGCIVSQAVTHSLVLLKMGKIIARNMLSWLELLISHYGSSSWLSTLFIFHYIFLRLAKQSQFFPLQNAVYVITLPFMVCKKFTLYINDVLPLKCPVPGPKG